MRKNIFLRTGYRMICRTGHHTKPRGGSELGSASGVAGAFVGGSGHGCGMGFADAYGIKSDIRFYYIDLIRE